MTAEPRAPRARHRLLAKAALLPILLAVLPPAGPAHPVAAAAPVAGRALAWGGNDYAQVGDGTSTARPNPTPVAMPSGTSVTAVAGGDIHSLAVTASGQVLAWGDDDQCQVGTAPCVGTVATPQQVALPAGTTVSSVAAGDYHSLALTSDGRVLAWGLNDYGQLGGGTAGGSFPSAALVCAPGTSGPCPAGPFLSGVTAIAAGGLHSLAVTGDGRAFAWGSNLSGELGAASLADRSSTPLAVAVPPGTLVSGVAAGHDHSLALTSDGRVLAWGSNSSGQLGIGAAASLPGTSLSPTVLPTPVPLPSGSVAAQVSASAAGSLALTTTGKVLAWGANGNGQVGDGTTTDRASPTPSSTGQAVVTALAAGRSHVLAITSSGSLLSWGGNASGQLGQGTPGSDGLTPAPVVLPAGLQVTAAGGGGHHSLLVTPDDVLTVTPAGSGTGSVTSAPAGIDCGASCVHAFAAGTAVTLTATPAPGSTFGGWSGSGCSGTGTCTVTLGGDAAVTATFVLMAPPTYTLAVTRSGSGSGTITSTPAGIACGSVCSAGFSSGTSVTLTAAAGAESLFSGWSGAGCSGTGTCTVVVTGPTTVTATFDPGRTLSVTRTGRGTGSVTSNPAGIDCGATCSAAFPPGTVVSLGEMPGDQYSSFAGWGGACSGSLTNCTVTLDSDQAVTASFTIVNQTLSVTASPAGTGSVTSSPPGISCGAACAAPFPHGTPVTLTAVGGPDPDSTFAGWMGGGCSGTAPCTITMNTDVSVTATFQGRAPRVIGWGADDFAQLGDGPAHSGATAPVPARFPPGTVISAVAAGQGHSLALTPSGHVLAWGQSAFCQLGTGPTTTSPCSAPNVTAAIPVAIPPGVTVTAIAAGENHSLALTSTGQVLAWGFNNSGQLGDGTLNQSAAPEQITLPAGTVITAIAAGENHSLALTSDGRVLAWGDNGHGQVGVPGVPLVPQPEQVQLPGGERATAIAGGNDHSLVATAAGHVLAWGGNDHGQLGIGAATPVAVPLPSAAAIPAGASAVAVTAGASSSAAITAGGQVLTWGTNSFGELGNGSTTDSPTPAAINLQLPAGARITEVAAGSLHMLAMTSGGQLLGWGDNSLGQMNTTCPTGGCTRPVPIRVGAPVAAIGAGSSRRFDLAVVGHPIADLDGDGTTDPAVYRPSTGEWFATFGSAAPYRDIRWGVATDIPVPADYDGAGRSQITVYRPSTGQWFVLHASGGYTITTWGRTGDIPVPADYDGAGRSQIAVYRPSTGQWFVLHANGGYTITTWGQSGDVPVPADYDGAGRPQTAVYRPSTGQWFVLHADGSYTATIWGGTGDVPVPADYDGIGSAQLTVYRPGTGQWFILHPAGASPAYSAPTWGSPGDIPQPGDYNGGGQGDLTVYRPGAPGIWYVLPGGGGPYQAVGWGASGDIPVVLPAAIRQAFF